MASLIEVLSTRAMIAASGRARAAAGRAMCASIDPNASMRSRSRLSISQKPVAPLKAISWPIRPEIGTPSRARTTTNRMNSSAHRKSGMARTKPAAPSTAASPTRPRQYAPASAIAPAQPGREQHRHQAQLDGRRQAAEHQLHHVLAHRDRRAEIAAGEVPQVVDELEADALVQPRRACAGWRHPLPSRPDRSAWRSDRPAPPAAGRTRPPPRRAASGSPAAAGRGGRTRTRVFGAGQGSLRLSLTRRRGSTRTEGRQDSAVKVSRSGNRVPSPVRPRQRLPRTT